MLKTPAAVAAKQVELCGERYSRDARPVRPLNDRVVPETMDWNPAVCGERAFQYDPIDEARASVRDGDYDRGHAVARWSNAP